MENQTPPLDHRTKTIADFRELLDFLAANPDVPLDRYGNPLSYSIAVHLDTDAAGLAELARIAEALGVPVTDVSGGAPGPGETHFFARRSFGSAEYQANYIVREHLAAHDVELAHVKNLRSCGCGGVLTDGDLVAGKKRCAACVPGEQVVLHIRQIGGSQHGLCGEIGGQATHASAATCPRCVAVLVEAEPKFAGRTAVES